MSIALTHQPATAGAGTLPILEAELADCLAQGRLALPSFPDVAVRIRRVLADERATPAQIERVLGSEPALAAQLMRLANSAALNPAGRAVTAIRTAVARLGINIVRSATISFAMSQVRHAGELKGLETRLDALWRRSTLVAALCYVSASHCPGLDPDEALLTGLLHGVGRLFLLSRLNRYPDLLANPVACQQLEQAWQVRIATAILEQWEMPPAIVRAIGSQDEGEREHAGPADLADVLLVANLLASFRDSQPELMSALQHVPAMHRMGPDGAQLLAIIDASRQQLDTLQAAFGP
ncbi:MAG TPA: HDOD domain-containing protein [Steroidobacteraceae bacterium]|nr:HDOD domain-containing protein [Steroidobacteraceae bacterium]